MNALNFQKTESNYGAGYIKNIRQTYEQHHHALREIAKTPPSDDATQMQTLDLMEHRLLKSQDRLLELSTHLKVSNLEEVSEILELWHDAAITEVSPDNIRLSDKLVLVMYRYMQAAHPPAPSASS